LPSERGSGSTTDTGTTNLARAAYPEKPVTIVVAWPVGGATDLLTRTLRDTFSKALGGQTVIKSGVGVRKVAQGRGQQGRRHY